MRNATRKWLAAGLAIALGASVAPMVVAADTTGASAGDHAPERTRTGPLTIEQAVAEVQHDTHGKVLRANSRRYGDVTEYWIKVLTPDGRVRVISLRSQPPRAATGKSEETH